MIQEQVTIGPSALQGELTLPDHACGLVVAVQSFLFGTDASVSGVRRFLSARAKGRMATTEPQATKD